MSIEPGRESPGDGNDNISITTHGYRCYPRQGGAAWVTPSSGMGRIRCCRCGGAQGSTSSSLIINTEKKKKFKKILKTVLPRRSQAGLFHLSPTASTSSKKPKNPIK